MKVSSLNVAFAICFVLVFGICTWSVIWPHEFGETIDGWCRQAPFLCVKAGYYRDGTILGGAGFAEYALGLQALRRLIPAFIALQTIIVLAGKYIGADTRSKGGLRTLGRREAVMAAGTMAVFLWWAIFNKDLYLAEGGTHHVLHVPPTGTVGLGACSIILAIGFAGLVAELINKIITASGFWAKKQ